MNRKVRKLTLNRDTMCRLTPEALAEVVGGASLRACSEVEPCRTDRTEFCTQLSNCCR